MVRIGIIGCGEITKQGSLPSLAGYKHAKIAAMCDRDEAKAAKLARQFNLDGVDIVSDWQELINRDDVDAVFINTPNYLHSRMTIASANAGKHVLVEKPMAISNKEARGMVRAARKNKTTLMVEQTHRFEPLHRAAKDVIDSGMLGDIWLVRGRIGNAGPEYWSESRWFFDKKKSGGGTMMDVGVHMLDLLRWFSGKKVREVKATITTLKKKISVDDSGMVLMTFEDGTLGICEASWISHPYEISTVVYGTKGRMVTLMGYPDPIVVYQAKVGKGQDPNAILKEVRPEIASGNGWGHSIRHFLDCIRNKKRPLVPGEEGQETMKVMFAAYESSRTGKKVRVS